MNDSVTERTRETVELALAELNGEYDSFETVEKTWTHSPESHQRVVERADRDSLGGAGVWITNEDGEVLLVRNDGDDGWADPGGKVEAGETHEAAARREVREETGVECELTGVREVHVVEHRPARSGGPSVYETIVIFDGEYVRGEPRPREGEIAEIGWFSAPPADVLYEEVAKRPFPASD